MLIIQQMNPIQPMLRLWAKKKLVLIASSWPKIVSAMTPHEMKECSDVTLVYSSWTGIDKIEQSYWTKFLEFGPTLNPLPYFMNTCHTF